MVLLYTPSLVACALGIAVALVAAMRRSGKGWQFIAAIGVAVCWWSAGQALWLGEQDPERLAGILRFQYVAVAAVPVLWYWFAAAHAGYRRWLRPSRMLLVALPSIAFLVLVFQYAPEQPNLMWRDMILPPEVPIARMRQGPGFWLFAIFGYGLIALSSVLLFVVYAHVPHYRSQMLVTVFAPVLPAVLNVLFLAGVTPMTTDPTPLGFAVSCGFIIWALSRRRLLDIAPLARALAFEHLHDAVIVLDTRNRIVDANEAANRLLGTPEQALAGRTLAEVMPELPAWSASHLCTLVRARHEYHLQVSLEPIAGPHGTTEGLVLTLRDVTAMESMNQQLREAKAQLQEANLELERFAHTDVLTGLANRRLLIQRLDQEFARARRHGLGLALAMIDLDHFKRVNDRRGHLVGDEVLAATGATLLALKRPADVAARYGGEELALLLTDIDAEGALAAIRRVWQALRGNRHRDSQGESFGVTCSIGIAILDDSDETPNALIARADRALYRAKAEGRDRVTEDAAT